MYTNACLISQISSIIKPSASCTNCNFQSSEQHGPSWNSGNWQMSLIPQSTTHKPVIVELNRKPVASPLPLYHMQLVGPWEKLKHLEAVAILLITPPSYPKWKVALIKLLMEPSLGVIPPCITIKHNVFLLCSIEYVIPHYRCHIGDWYVYMLLLLLLL